MGRYLQFSFLFLWLSSGLLAQSSRTHTLSLHQGLPEYYVSGLVQDKAGFIWVATRDGLARYDGRHFKTFRHRPFGGRSLAHNVISSIQSISDTTLFIHLENGNLQVFNPITEQFTDVVLANQVKQSQVGIASVALSADQREVWGRVGTQIFRFNRQTKQFKNYAFPALPNPDKLFPGSSFLLTAGKRLYIPFPGYLLEFNTQTETFQVWTYPLVGMPGKTINFYNTKIFQRSNGEILIGGAQQLIAFNPNTHRFRSIPVSSPVDTQVGLIYEARDRNVYFTHGMNVYRLSPDDRMEPIWTAPRIDYQNYFHALLVDHSGVLWIGTNGDGIQQVDLQALPFKTYPYQTHFVHDVLSLELGLSLPAWAKTTTHIYRLRLGGMAPYITVGFDGGMYHLFRAEPDQNRLRSVLAVPRKTLLEGITGGNGLRVLPNNTIWMYSPYSGLHKADSTGRLLETYPCSVNWVSTIHPVGDWVWLASETNGLYAYDTKKRRIVRHLRYQPGDSTSLVSDHVLSLSADPANPAFLWVGTREGLSRLDTRTMRFKHWTEKQGLPSTTINTLLTDRQGNLWFSTGKGISRIDPRTGQMRHYSTADGLLDIEYRQNHAVQLPDGRLAFGGATGITLFDPLALKEMRLAIPTVLTGLRLANVPVEPGQDGSPLTLPLNTTPVLRLQPKENFLSLEFAGLQYNKPATLQYRYQLSGVNTGWVYAGNQNVANYTELDPGEYEFRVNTADASGRWSPLIKTLRIIIEPPWWKTGWAYALYLLMLAGLVRAYIQYRVNQAELRQEILLKEQEAQLVKENADWQTRFFTNITHEFRTPLTLIISPLDRLIEQSRPGSLQRQYHVMYRNAHRLLRLINQLLDIAKLEAGQLVVVESRGNLISFFAELVESFRLRAERKDVELTYEAEDFPADSWFDAQKLETIGYNLLANALKFTPEGGRIKVVLQKVELADQPAFRLQIIDSGVGIPAEQLPRIFDRFFQGSNTEASLGGGTGIGLFLVNEFTKLLGGQVTVESQPEKGTTFTVSLPMKGLTGELRVQEELPALSHPIRVAPVVEKPAETAAVASTATAPLVLVVDDNEELREFVAGELAHKYRVITAADGQQGWQLCLQELPELVISDVMMPLMNGFTLVERIKTTPLTAHVAVILLTAKTMAENRLQGLSAGANDYLTKPFNAQELSMRVANLLQHQQQLRQYWQQHSGQLGAPTVLVGAPSGDDPFLIKLYEVLDRELANSAYSVEQLAHELAVSPRTLHRKLSALIGTTANELIRSYRLRKAAVFLQEGFSVADAAQKVGFENLSYFAKSFKAQFDIAPSAYSQARKTSKSS